VPENRNREVTARLKVVPFPSMLPARIVFAQTEVSYGNSL